jgi:hypothetical protein
MAEIPGLPTIPTDNLYKFIALTGVLMFIVAPIFYVNFYISYHKIELDAIDSLRVPSWDYYESKSKIEHGETVTNAQKELVEKWDSFKREGSNTQLDYHLYTRFSCVITLLSFIMAVMGLALAIIGFWFWYNRVQKPLDAILLNEVKEKKNKGNSR